MHRSCVGAKGQLPNYGNNDGALFFPLTDQDYSDYRPQINALYAAITADLVHKNKDLAEEALWLVGNHFKSDDSSIELDSQELKHYEVGGIYTIQCEDSSFTFLKCQSYKDRPAQADNMHLDIWVDGKNYFRDSGTYKYNTSSELVNYFSGTAGHNTVMVEDYNQMTRGSRFIWYNWTKESESDTINESKVLGYSVKAKMFPKVNGGLIHKRVVLKNKTKLVWTIADKIEGNNNFKIRQLWHPNPDLLKEIRIKAVDENGHLITRSKIEGWWSPYYGKKESAPIWVYETQGKSITTTIEITQ